jgi:putative ABC transport system permease protein
MITQLRFALRGLWKNRGFSTVAVLSLALGIGATTALFNVVYGVLISPYPYKQPEKIWSPHFLTSKGDDIWANYHANEFATFAKLPAFSEAMGTRPEGDMLLTGEFSPQMLYGVSVTANAFEFLGVPAILGRGLLPSDLGENGEPADVIVLGYPTWQRLFNGSPEAIGKMLRLNDHIYTVVGVMPPRFHWWTDGFWKVLSENEGPNVRQRVPIARLKPGVAPAVAEQQIAAFHIALQKEGSKNVPKDEFKTKLVNYLDMTVASGEMEKALWILFGAVILLLSIACANVANLQLARGSTRVREMAIRVSIGASRWALIRQLLGENLLLALIGGALGWLLAFWATQAIAALIPPWFIPGEARIESNIWALIFSTSVSMVTGILFGLAPAFQASHVDLSENLKDSAAGSGAGARGVWTRKALVVAEISLSMVLLVAAGLMARTFIALHSVELGFRPDNVISVGLLLPETRYGTLEQRNRFALEFLERAKSIRGVQAACIGNGGMPFNGFDTTVEVPGASDTEKPHAQLVLASADYLKAMGIPLLMGRELTPREVQDSSELALINKAALNLWPAGENPIGKRVKLDMLLNPGRAARPESASGWVTIVGVIGDTRSGLRSAARPQFVVPFTLIARSGRTLIVRTTSEASVISNSLREQLRQMDREQPLSGAATFQEIIARQTAQPRFTMAVFSAFAIVGLMLAAFGIYSVLSFFVAQRTRELGVRMALGARWHDVLALVVNSGSRLLVVGLVIGVALSFASARLLSQQLYEIKPTDPITYIIVALALSAVGIIACIVPASRAARVNPIEALRHD